MYVEKKYECSPRAAGVRCIGLSKRVQFNKQHSMLVRCGNDLATRKSVLVVVKQVERISQSTALLVELIDFGEWAH